MCYPDPMPIAINLSQKMVKIMDSRVSLKIKVTISFKNNFTFRGQNTGLEVKVAKLPIEIFSVLDLQNMKMFLFSIIPLFRSISVALQSRIFPICHLRLKKMSSKTLISP